MTPLTKGTVSASFCLLLIKVVVSCFSLVSFPSMPQPSFLSTPTNAAAPEKVDAIEDSELMGDDLDSLLDCVSTDMDTTEVKSLSAFRAVGCCC